MPMQTKMPLNEFTAPFTPPLEVKETDEAALQDMYGSHDCCFAGTNAHSSSSSVPLDMASCLVCNSNEVGRGATDGSFSSATDEEETDVDKFLLDCTSSRLNSRDSHDSNSTG